MLMYFMCNAIANIAKTIGNASVEFVLLYQKTAAWKCMFYNNIYFITITN